MSKYTVNYSYKVKEWGTMTGVEADSVGEAEEIGLKLAQAAFEDDEYATDFEIEGISEERA